MSSDWLFWLFLAVLGLEIGSFANVCIYRWPLGLTISRPLRSQCCWCNEKISWKNNIPILSFCWLGGRCSHCRSPISWRYPLVEFLLAFFWLGTYILIDKYSPNSHSIFTLTCFSLCFVGVVTTFVDIDWRIIPDQATYFLMFIGLVTSFWNPFLPETPNHFVQSLIGLATGGGFLLVIARIGEHFWGKEVIGMGDIKLVGAYGAVFGIHGIMLLIFSASMLGALFSIGGIAFGFVRRQQYIPFGPFLNLAALITFVWMIVGSPFGLRLF